jgi:hypothetical protein
MKKLYKISQIFMALLIVGVTMSSCSSAKLAQQKQAKKAEKCYYFAYKK